jgi:hypothetical protein
MHRRLDGPQSRFENYGEQKKNLPFREIEPRFFGRLTLSLVTIPAEIFHLIRNEYTYFNV